jgi:sulfotransferase
MDKSFIMLSGIPRSGSQVLASLLNQHPMIHASTTSPVVDMITIFNNNWPQISAALVNPDPNQYSNMMRGLVFGAYEHVSKPIVVDKNRIWPRQSHMMKDVLHERPKIICTVRSIPSVLASYILLIRKNSHKTTFVDQDLIDKGMPINDKNRCKILWERYINVPYMALRHGFQSGAADLLVLRYLDIVNNSQGTMDQVCQFVGIDSCGVRLDSLQPMPENDSYHGGLEGLHDVRPTMAQTSPEPEKVIGHELTNLYTDMQLDFWNRK